MVEAGPNSDVGQIDAAAIMAIRGLAALAEAAAHEGQEKAMEKIVDQLFRQCPTTSVQLSHARRKARAGSAADIPSAAWHEKAAAAAHSLIVAFTTAPQTVLGICEQTLKKARENDATKGAMLFLSDVLAMPSQHSMAHAGSVAADVLSGRPELREWMVAQVETLNRGGQLEKGPAAMLSCFEDILRASAPPPPPPIPSVLSPVPPGSGRRSVSSATVSPARPSAPLQAPLPPDTPGSVMMEDDPPLLSPGQPAHAHLALEVGELPENAALLSPATVNKMTSAGSATGEVLRPALDVAIVAPILLLRRVPARMPDVTIKVECNGGHGVVDIMRPEHGPPGEVFVEFEELRHAAECYEKLSESPPEWSDGTPLVFFCEESLAALSQRLSKDPRIYVWVAGVGSRRGADGVLRRLKENAGLEPNTVLPVNGRTPGVVLQFSTLAQGQAAVQALARQTRGGPPSPPRLPSGPQRAARLGDDPDMRPQPGTRRYMPERDITPPSSRGSGPSRGPGTCTIWVGQVCRDVNKAALLRAFEEYGHITGHTFLHASDCAFIDFETERDAAAAKEALEGALFDGHRIRIEFKDEARGPPRGGGRRMPPAYGGRNQYHRGGDGGRASSPPIRRRRLSPSSPPYPGPPYEGSTGYRDYPPGFAPQEPPWPGRELPEPPHISRRAPVDGRADRPRKWDARPDGTDASQAVPSWQPPVPSSGSHATGSEGALAESRSLQQHRSSLQGQSTGEPSPAPALSPWKGPLAKSGIPLCDVVCQAALSSAEQVAVSNSSRFPDKLDITLRTDTGSVLSSITPAPGTCILKLSLAAHNSPQEQRSQRNRLLDLLHGLSSKSKTGVVERLPLPDGILCQLYLIPPSSSVAQRLGVEWSKDECLFGMLALQRQH
ncbi:g423 [Coccomyxa viridis]|uniref:G423 protein n=1 Tax=Coccomyxa viridis TaxID=1274662 RepID=A0ABP1FHA3_9CHLO